MLKQLRISELANGGGKKSPSRLFFRKRGRSFVNPLKINAVAAAFFFSVSIPFLSVSCSQEPADLSPRRSMSRADSIAAGLITLDLYLNPDWDGEIIYDPADSTAVPAADLSVGGSDTDAQTDDNGNTWGE
jgi:hypothetical protein